MPDTALLPNHILSWNQMFVGTVPQNFQPKNFHVNGMHYILESMTNKRLFLTNATEINICKQLLFSQVPFKSGDENVSITGFKRTQLDFNCFRPKIKMLYTRLAIYCDFWNNSPIKSLFIPRPHWSQHANCNTQVHTIQKLDTYKYASV